MRFLFILLSVLLTACQSTSHKQLSWESYVRENPVNTELQQNQSSEKIEMTQDEILELSRQFINEDEPEKALEALSTIRSENRANPLYIKLKRDATQKTVANLRYKARVLYEKSLQQTGRSKQSLLKECRRILEAIIKNHPEYDDMYAVKNNLKQINQELRA